MFPRFFHGHKMHFLALSDRNERFFYPFIYCKIPKISPSMYKPPPPPQEPVTQKTVRYIAPPNICPRGLVLGKLPSKTK